MTTHMPHHSRPIRVLLAEDNLSDVHLIREVFKTSTQPVEITRVKDGQEAMDYLRGEGTYMRPTRPDLILLDLNMPKKTGLEVLNEVRSDPRFQDVVIIVLTNSNLDVDLAGAYDSQANFYIVKPSNLDQLFVAMRHIEDIWLKGLPERRAKG